MKGAGRNNVISAIAALRHFLDKVEQRVDGKELPHYTFDLSNPVIIGEMVVHKLLEQPRHELKSLSECFGAGVYVLYYDGPFPAYEAIRGTECPIYAGSASPKNKTAANPREQGTALYTRLMHHLTRSIVPAEVNLDANHFFCRHLVVQSGLELAAEQFLIRRFHPGWNKESKVCPGFGKHGDKQDRQSELSSWDLLHPGRSFAKGQKPKARGNPRATPTVDGVIEGIRNHFLKLLRADEAFWMKRFNSDWVRNATLK